MKIRPLPDTDLARIAVLSGVLQRKALLQMRGGHAPFSYEPLRKSFADILNVTPVLFGATDLTEWSKIEASIRRARTTPEGIDANLAAAKALYEFASDHAIVGRPHEFFPMQTGGGQAVKLWHSMLLTLDGSKAIVPFIDPRRSKKLTSEARRFAFSMMHERIRIADPDLAAVELAVVQFTAPEKGPRKARLYTAEGQPLFSLGDLEDMIATTYRLWTEICQERAAEARRKGTGTSGPLL